MHLRDTVGWMVRWVLVVPVVWGKHLLKFEGEGVVDSPVSVISRVVITMGEWVQVGLVRGVPEQEQVMVKEVGREPRAGWEG